MTDNEKRAKIAEVHLKLRPLGNIWIEIAATQPNPGNVRNDHEVPDYLNSKSAINDALSLFEHDEEAQKRYVDFLISALGKCKFNVAHATARQRADAFLMALRH